MPKRKITLEEAFATFEQHGLQVEIKAIQQDPELDNLTLADFTESTVEQSIPKQHGKKSITIKLHAAHTIGSGGHMVDKGTPNQRIENAGVQTYGPGVCTVPIYIAAHLLHQDTLAQRADERFLDRKLRSFVIVPRRLNGQMVNVGIMASDDDAFDMSSFLGSLGDHNLYSVR